MIRKVEVLISFPQGAYFMNDIHMDIYYRLINFVKNISCMCIDVKCNECDEKNSCKYFELTGQNFHDYPGLIVKNSLFEKKKYDFNEQKTFVFYFIGNKARYSNYVSVFFEQLHQNLFNNLFYLKDIRISDLDIKKSEYKHILVKTPISSKDFICEYNQMVAHYNAQFDTDFELLSGNALIQNEHKVDKALTFKTKRINMSGYIGNVLFDHSILLDDRLVEIGIGRFNYVGGGQIEIED